MSSPSGAGTPSHRHPSRGHLISSGITTRGKAASDIRHQAPRLGKGKTTATTGDIPPFSAARQRAGTLRNAWRGGPHLLHGAGQDRPQEEAQAVPEGGAEGADGLRRVRAQGQEGTGRHERREQRRGGPEAEQGDGVGARGGGGGGAAAAPPGREDGGAVALRAVRRGAAPLRAGGLRQEGAARARAQRAGRPRRRAARAGKLHGGEVHLRIQ